MLSVLDAASAGNSHIKNRLFSTKQAYIQSPEKNYQNKQTNQPNEFALIYLVS